MRKVFVFAVIFFVFASLTTAPAAVDEDAALFVGDWIQISERDDGTVSYMLVHIRADHTLVCRVDTVGPDGSQGLNRTHIGSWEATKDGAHLVTGNNTSMDVILTDNGYMAQKLVGGAYSMFSPVRPYPLENDTEAGPVSLSQLETGVIIPAGVYAIGLDIPAGVYRFEMTGKASHIAYFMTADAYRAASEFDLNARSTVVGRLRLQDGGVLVVEKAPVTILYAHALFEEAE